MQIRITGSYDLLERIKNIIDKQAKVYPNRGNNNDSRLYIDIDDRDVEQWIDLFENSEYPIEINPNDFY